MVLMIALALASTVGLACADPNQPSSQPLTQATSDRPVKTMKIRMTIEGTAITGTLDGNETARDFAAKEKVGELPKKQGLSSRGEKPP